MLRRILRLAILGLASAAAPLHAQTADGPAGDPPSIAGRLDYEEGSVSLQPGGVSDWNAAALNRPLTQGDSLWSDDGARAEIDLGSARVRMDQRTSLTIVALDDRTVQLRLQGGSIDVAVSNVANLDWFEIDAPSATISVVRPGEYRLTIDNAGTTAIAVRDGLAQVQGTDPDDPGPAGARVATGERGLFGANGAYAVLPAEPPDDFDRWCQDRQARWNQEQAVARYVSSDAVGFQDLGDHGEWQQEPDDGYVWFPTDVAVDWVPYSTGHWTWIMRWGWTWVDEAPWGFAPFHYGRWGHYGNRWGWVPCPPRQRPVFAPALVAWYGGHGAPGAPALGGGPAVGWLPLAPGEVFIPGYAVSPHYLQRVNLTNTRRVRPEQISAAAAAGAPPAHYANAGVAGAVVVVPQVSFTGSQAVARHRLGPPMGWQSLAPSARVPAIAPERASIAGGLTLSHVATPPVPVTARPTLAGHAPADNHAFRHIPERPVQMPPQQQPETNVFERRSREIEQAQQTGQGEEVERERTEQAVPRQVHPPAGSRFERAPEARVTPLPSIAPAPPMMAPPEPRPAPPPPVAAPAEVRPVVPAAGTRAPQPRPEGRRIPESNFAGSTR